VLVNGARKNKYPFSSDLATIGLHLVAKHSERVILNGRGPRRSRRVSGAGLNAAEGHRRENVAEGGLSARWKLPAASSD
jgi:hypothetical protein